MALSPLIQAQMALHVWTRMSIGLMMHGEEVFTKIDICVLDAGSGILLLVQEDKPNITPQDPESRLVEVAKYQILIGRHWSTTMTQETDTSQGYAQPLKNIPDTGARKTRTTVCRSLVPLLNIPESIPVFKSKSLPSIITQQMTLHLLDSRSLPLYIVWRR